MKFLAICLCALVAISAAQPAKTKRGLLLGNAAYATSYAAPVLSTHTHSVHQVPVAVDRPYAVPVDRPVVVDRPYPVVQHVAHPVPQPYPVPVVKHVAQPYPVAVDRPVVVDRPVAVPQPYPQPYPVVYEKTVVAQPLVHSAAYVSPYASYGSYGSYGSYAHY